MIWVSICFFFFIWKPKFDKDNLLAAPGAKGLENFEFSGLSKVIFLSVADAEGKGGKTLALEVEAEGEAKGLVFCV